MKNSNKNSFTYSAVNEPTAKQEVRNNLYTSTTKLVVIVLSFIFSTQSGICQQTPSVQNKNIGLAVSSMIGPDGYGILYLPSVYYRKNRSSYFAGPVIQNQKMNVSGVQFNYNYSIVDIGEADDKRLELYCFVTSLYQNNALLSKQTLKDESLENSESISTKNISQLKLKAIEFYGGFGLKIKLFQNVKWISSIGLGGYATFNPKNYLYYNMSTYNSHDFGFILKTGISIDLKSK